MELRLLKLRDATALLGFEEENRDWFERHVEARPPNFYSAAGVRGHIEHLLEQYQAGNAYPGIIAEGDEILGRINLTMVDAAKARLGYRVGASHVGKGVASFGLQALLESACPLVGLSTLFAIVSVENIASQRVLYKQGFQAVGKRKQYSRVMDRLLDCIEYELALRER